MWMEDWSVTGPTPWLMRGLHTAVRTAAFDSTSWLTCLTDDRPRSLASLYAVTVGVLSPQKLTSSRTCWRIPVNVRLPVECLAAAGASPNTAPVLITNGPTRTNDLTSALSVVVASNTRSPYLCTCTSTVRTRSCSAVRAVIRRSAGCRNSELISESTLGRSRLPVPFAQCLSAADRQPQDTSETFMPSWSHGDVVFVTRSSHSLDIFRHTWESIRTKSHLPVLSVGVDTHTPAHSSVTWTPCMLLDVDIDFTGLPIFHHNLLLLIYHCFVMQSLNLLTCVMHGPFYSRPVCVDCRRQNRQKI